MDLTRLLPGPMCTWYLRGMGARVTKIETPNGGDYLRFSPPVTAQGDGVWFETLNAGKESVALDLKRSNHQKALKALIARADVLVESFRPGVMARLGFDPERMLEEHPRLVICSISGYGQTGSMRDVPGHDLTYQAVSGALSLAERISGTPTVPGTLVADTAGGALTAAMQICSALFHRERTGAGCWLDVSMTESTMALNAPYVATADALGTNPKPGAEMLTGGSHRYQVYACMDGRSVAFAPIEPKFWEAFCRAANVSSTMKEGALRELFLQRPRDEWVALLVEACCAPVLELDELETFGHHAERGCVTRKDGVLRVSHPNPNGSETAHLPAPRLGEHTESVLQRIGFDIRKLEES